MLENVLDFAFARRLGANCRVAENAIVERLLSFAGLFTRIVLAQGDAMIQIQMEMLKRAVLNTQRAQCRTVNLSRQVLEQQPSGEPGSVA